jgi:ubiquinone/menaquinone biosynthesis C-methylase UbiE
VAVEQTPESIRERVREKYADRARRVADGGTAETSASDCCTPSSTVAGASTSCCSPITSGLYAADETALVPDDAIKASLGCGNPTALAELSAGERVLDLGSGGGIDVLLSARRVGPTGFAYGLDMTDEMLALARKNAAEQGAANVEFLKGHIEEIPLPDNHVQVVISNCVINLSADKGRVIREAFRVLAPGGRFAVSDVVAQGTIPPDLRHDMEAWVGCVAGALEDAEYRRLLTEAGFEDVDVEVTRVYDPRQIAASADREWDQSALARFDASGGRLVSAFIRARKPSEQASACCAPTCCSNTPS